MDKQEFEEQIEQIKDTLVNWKYNYDGYICYNLKYSFNKELGMAIEQEFLDLLADKYDNGREQLWGWFGSPTLPHNQLKRVKVLGEFKELYIANHYPEVLTEASDSILGAFEEELSSDKGNRGKQA